jgi:hypothetical protein
MAVNHSFRGRIHVKRSLAQAREVRPYPNGIKTNLPSRPGLRNGVVIFRRLSREGEEIMANITRRNPLSELTTFQERLNQFFSPPFAPLWRLAGGAEPTLTASSFVPAVDIYEDEHNIILTAETPGIDEKDLDISVENGVLTVSGAGWIMRRNKTTFTGSSAATAASRGPSPCRPLWTRTASRPTSTMACLRSRCQARRG